MTEADVIEIIRAGYLTGLRMAGPAVLSGLLVGLAVALFQALTQIQEMTLTFLPKIVVILGVAAVTLPTMYGVLEAYTLRIADMIVGI